MYQSVSHLLDAEDRVEVYLVDEIPIVEFLPGERGAGRVTIHVPDDSPNESIAWLRDLANKCESLAEVIEAANVGQVSA